MVVSESITNLLVGYRSSLRGRYSTGRALACVALTLLLCRTKTKAMSEDAQINVKDTVSRADPSLEVVLICADAANREQRRLSDGG